MKEAEIEIPLFRCPKAGAFARSVWRWSVISRPKNPFSVLITKSGKKKSKSRTCFFACKKVRSILYLICFLKHALKNSLSYSFQGMKRHRQKVPTFWTTEEENQFFKECLKLVLTWGATTTPPRVFIVHCSHLPFKC